MAVLIRVHTREDVGEQRANNARRVLKELSVV